MPIDLSMLGDALKLKALIALECFRNKDEIISIGEEDKLLELIMAICTPFRGNEKEQRKTEFQIDGLKLLRFLSEIKTRAGE